MKYFRTYLYNGKEQEVTVEAKDELDAETEFHYIEQNICRGDDLTEFEWTSPIYDLKIKIETEEINTKDKKED